MDIIFTKSKLEILLGKTKAKAKQGAAVVKEKTGDAVLSAKLQKRVKDLEDEIDLQLAEVGALVYATHTGHPSDSGEMQEILEYIDTLYEEIAGHEYQLMLMQGWQVCPACEAMNAPENAFCQECGKSLKEESAAPVEEAAEEVAEESAQEAEEVSGEIPEEVPEDAPVSENE